VKACPNISLLFGEAPLLERFALAAAAGFDTVELWWPRGEDLHAVRAAAREAGVGVAALNFDAGDMPAGDRGVLSNPHRQDEFRDNVPVALKLASDLGCRQLNALVGVALKGCTREEQLALAVENLRFAADHAREQGASVLVEAVNTLENGPYLVSTTAAAAELVARVERPNVSLQYDAYHMQRMEGNLSATVREYASQIAHVQVADSPGRHEPGSGEINFRYLLGVLEQVGYDGYLGLEYKPRGGTEESLEWLPRDQRSGALDVEALTFERVQVAA